MDITLERNWENYRSKVWDHVDPESHQMKTIKVVFYAAWFDSLTTLLEIVGSPDMSEEKGEQLLDKLLNESTQFLKNDIQKRMNEMRN